MEKFEKNNNLEIEKAPEKASDIELAAFFVRHIENPCEVEIEKGKTANIRSFYIREAKKALETIINPFAKELLEKKIKEYEGEKE